MPETRLAKTRATLPEGYKFGDGRHEHDWRHYSIVTLSWHCRCGAQLTDLAYARAPRTAQVERVGLPRKFAGALDEWKPAHENAAIRRGWNTIEPD